MPDNAATPEPPESRSPIRLKAREKRRSPAYRRLAIGLTVLGLLLAAARLAMPFFLKSAINKRLSHIPDYRGNVESVGIALWRGAYFLERVKVVKLAGNHKEEPFFFARSIDFSIAWREIFKGKFVSDIVVNGGRLNFVKAPSPENSQLAADRRWQAPIKDIFPIDITYLEINEGYLRYRDETTSPVVDIDVMNMKVVATGLRNRPAETRTALPASLTVTGDSIGRGKLTIKAAGEPLADRPHFELHVRFEDVSLAALNQFLLAYGNVDVKSGVLKVYFEMAARDGHYEGYVKPFFANVQFYDISKEHGSLGHKIWQVIAGALVNLFKSSPQKEFALRVPFAGDFNKVDVGTWPSIVSMLHNAFVKALPAGFETGIRSAAIPPRGKPVTPPLMTP